LFRSTKFWNVIVGPVGSAKTTACIFWMLKNAAEQHPAADGVRRTRYVISRSSYAQLRTTVLLDIRHWLGPIARWKPSESLVVIDAPPIYSEWYLIPLESVDDQRRLLSLQLSGVWFNEVREIPMDLVWAASGRIPRYPPATAEGVRQPFVLMDSNPGVINSEFHRFCMRIRAGEVPSALYIHQPSGLSPEADWRKYLAEGYYERLVQANSPRWVDVFVHGHWGRDESGVGVYSDVFDDAIHASAGLDLVPGRLTIIGLDPGRQPGAVLTQVDEKGTLLVLDEASAANTPLYAFLRDKIQPWRAQATGSPLLIVMDPTGSARTAVSNESPATVARSFGFTVMLAATNDVATRVRALDRLLTMRRGVNEPLIVVDSDRCPILMDGLRGAYRFKRKRDNVTLDPIPEKQHPISDVVDALQYVALAVSGYGARRLTERAESAAMDWMRRDDNDATVDLRGWA
jgi:hypothetical protein